MQKLPVFLIISLASLLFVGFSVESTAQVDPGHSHQGAAFDEGPRQFSRLMAGMPEINFPATNCSPDAVKFIEQGIGQLHGFLNFESERSFRHAAYLDTECAMAYWGMAMANAVWIRNYERAAQLVKFARDRLTPVHTNREVKYIEAIESLRPGVSAVNFAKGLREIWQDNPEDIEAKAFFVVTVWHNDLTQALGYGGGDYTSRTNHLFSLAKEVLEVSPNHPIHHYVIHMWDNPENYRLALDSADKIGFSGSGIAHLWHMGGHIYSHAKLLFERWWSQEASARVDHNYMASMMVFPYQIHNHAHNNEWLSRTLMETGDFTKSRQYAFNLLSQPRHPVFNRLDQYMHYQNGVDRSIEVLERGEFWSDAAKLLKSPNLRCDDLRERSSSYQSCLRLSALAEIFTGVSISNNYTNMNGDYDAEIAAVRAIEAGENPRRHLIRLKSLNHLASDWGLFQLTKYALIANSYDDATDFAQRMESQNVHNAAFKLLAAATYALAGDGQNAQATFAKLVKISQEVDVLSPSNQKLIKILKDANIIPDGEWRQRYSGWRSAHADRPDHSSLGPLLAQRFQAPEVTWIDQNNESQTLSLAMNGKPAVIAFLLGDCVHCDAQYALLDAQREKLSSKGIELLVVPENVGNMPAFKSMWAFDEFESIPLHGLFVLDAKKNVVWQDTGADAFLDIPYVMKELDRVLDPMLAKLNAGESL